MELNDTWVTILFVGITLLLIIYACCAPVSAATPRCEILSQGDIAYLGEYCDVSRVVSWGAQFAYFSGGYPTEVPTKIVDASGFMYRFYIDPAKFVVGDWWKWDGHYDRAGNQLAFTIKAGTRPAVVPMNTTNVTPVPTPIQEKNVTVSDNIVIARGEVLDYTYQSKDKGKAWLWLFESSNLYLGMPMEFRNDGYKYTFNGSITQSFVPDDYIAYIQFGGANNKQDVYYNLNNNSLESIYRSVTTIQLSAYPKVQYNLHFLKQVNNKEYSDDEIATIYINMREPEMVITDYYEKGDSLVVAGTTTLSLGTPITCIIDPEHWVTESEIKANTYKVSVTGTVDADRKFYVELPLQWDELSLGEHDIVLNGKSGLIDITIHKEFHVSDTYVIPTPTPAKVKVALDSEGNPLKIATPVPTPTPIPTPYITTVQPTPIQTIHNSTPTSTPTPRPTTVPRTPTPRPTATMITVPLNPTIACIAIGIMCILLRRRD
jgi:hypothetical protein